MNQRRSSSLFLFALIACIVASASNTCMAGEGLKIGFYELPPYLSADLEKHGVIGLLLEKALAGQVAIQYVSVPIVRLPYLINTEEIMVGVTTVDSLCKNSVEYKCSALIKAISVVLAYKPEYHEFDSVASLEELRANLDSIGQTKESFLFDKTGQQLKFREVKDMQQGLDLLNINRLKGFIMNEEVFDFKKIRKEFDQSIKKTKTLTLTPLHIIVKSNSKYQWVITSVNNYIQKNTYDGIWFDYYMNYATVRQ
jgi:hypothetical protein